MHPEQEKDSFTFLLQCLCSPGLLGQGLSLQCYKWLHFSFIGPKWLFSASPADFLYSTIFSYFQVVRELDICICTVSLQS